MAAARRANSPEGEGGDEASRRCWCCLESTSTKTQPLLHCGCACRGSAGWAHVSCLAQAAGAHSFEERGSISELWTGCPTCTHDWTGRVQLDLARVYARSCSQRPEEDGERQFAEYVLSLALKTHGAHVEALVIEERALTFCRQHYGPEDEQTIMAMESLANTYGLIREYEKALVIQREALEFYRRKDGLGGQLTLSAMGRLAETLNDMQQFGTAQKLLEERLETQRRTRPDHQGELVSAMQSLACVYCDAGEMEKAVPLFKESIAYCRREYGSAHPQTLHTVGNLGECYCKLADHSVAAPLLEEAVVGLSAIYGEEHLSVGYVQRWLQTNARKNTNGPLFKDYQAEQETPYERRAKRRRNMVSPD